MGGQDDDLLTELFSSKVRSAVLRHLLPRPHLGFSLTDLTRLLDIPISSLQHECYKLERIGVLIARRAGNARLYRPDPSCPVLAPLTALVVAAIGMEPALRAAVESVPGLDAAFLAGSIPPTTGRRAPSGSAPGPVRLVLTGEVPLEALDAALERVASAMAIPASGIELAFFRPDDWRARLLEGNRYVAELLAGPRLHLHGGAVDTATSPMTSES